MLLNIISTIHRNKKNSILILKFVYQKDSYSFLILYFNYPLREII